MMEGECLVEAKEYKLSVTSCISWILLAIITATISITLLCKCPAWDSKKKDSNGRPHKPRHEKWFYVWLIGLSTLGGFWALFLPLALSQKFDGPNADGNQLRLHLLYITGGVLALTTLGETHRKNTLEKHKNDQDHTRQVHAERRSRYTAAIEQLSSDKTSIRLGGVYSLVGLVDEWLADEKTIPNLEERHKEGQVIINNLCVYIRSSFELVSKIEELSEGTDAPKDYSGGTQQFIKDQVKFREEQEMRQTILSEIKKRLNGDIHIHKDGTQKILKGMWSDFNYDFSNTVFFYPVGFNNSYFGVSSNFSGANFIENADFSGANFIENADFSQAKFTKNTDFSQAEFAGVNFTEANFTENADFSQAKFTEANFTKAEFTKNADFSKVEFAWSADFSWVKFTEANFTEAKFTENADFSWVKIARNANFTKAEFTEANFTKAKFTWSTNFSWVKFTEAKFTKANFTEAELTGNANFTEANFTWSADFTRAKFAENADFTGVKFSQAKFSQAKFTQAKFAENADFTGAKFTENADFSKVEFTWSADFTRVEFTETNFTKAKFTWSADFSQAKFAENADFTGAKFTENADFSEAKFDEKPIFERALGDKTCKARFSCKADPEDYNFEVSPDSPYKIETEEKEYNETKFIIPKGTEFFDPDEPSEQGDNGGN